MEHLLKESLITTKDARELSGYTSDYLSRLVRTGKIKGERIGRSWIIDKESLAQFLETQGNYKVNQSRILASERAREYRTHRSLIHRAKKMLSISRSVAEPLYPLHIVVKDSLRSQVFALSVSFLVVTFGVFAAETPVIPQIAENITTTMFDAASGFDLTFADIPKSITHQVSAENNEIKGRVARVATQSSYPPVSLSLLTFDLSSVLSRPLEIEITETHSSFRASPVFTSAPVITVDDVRTFVVTMREVFKSPERAMNTLTDLYLATGEYAYKAIGTSFATYDSLIKKSGVETLALATTVRDALATAPAFVAKVNLALGESAIWLAHAAIHTDVMLAYGLATAAPESARVTFSLISNVGGTLAAVTTRVPALATALYLDTTTVPAIVAPHIAQTIFTAEYAGGLHFVALTRSITGHYLAFLENTGQAIYAGTDDLGSLASLAIRHFDTVASASEDMLQGLLSESSRALITPAQLATAFSAATSARPLGESLALFTYTTINDFFNSTSRTLVALLAPMPPRDTPDSVPAARVAAATSSVQVSSRAVKVLATGNALQKEIINSYPTYTTIIQGISEQTLNQSLASLRSDILATVSGITQPIAAQNITNQTTIQQVNMIQDLSNLIVRNGDFRGGTFANGASVSATSGSFDNLRGGTTNLGTTEISGSLTVNGVAVTGSGGGSGGSGNVSTSTSEVAGNLPYWTSTAAGVATLGSAANLNWDNASSLLTITGSASTSQLSAHRAYFGSTATSSFATNGALTLAQALGISSGGTASSTPLGGILVGNGSSAINSLTIGSNLSFDGTTLSATGGSTFATTSVSALYPLSWDTSTAQLSLAFGTTTSNTWAGTQSFSTASTTNLIVSSAGGSSTRCLQVAADGTVSATAGACGVAGAGIQNIGPANQLASNSTVTISTTTSLFNGLTVAETITGTASTLNWTPSLSGTLGIGGGGTGLSSVSGNQLLYSNSDGTAFLQVATSSLSIGGNANTATTLQTARTINGVSFNGSANIVVASTTLLGDTNTWSGNNTFSTLPILGTLSGLVGANNGLLYQFASSSLFGFTPQTNQLAKGNFLVGDDAGVAQATSSIFISSTGQVGIGTTSPSQALSVHGNGLISGNLLIAGLTATGTVSFSTALPISSGGTGTTTAPISQLLYGGANGVYQSVATSSLALGTGLNLTSGTLGYQIGGTNAIIKLADTTVTPGSYTNANITVDQQGRITSASNGAAGGGGGGGSFATSTAFGSVLNNYSLNTTDVIEFGGTSGTTSAKYWFDPNSQVAYLSGNVGIGTTSPSRTFSIQGNALFSGDLTVANLIATGTATIGTLNLTNALGLAYGGTGLSSLTGNRLLYSNSDGSALAQVATSSLYGASTGGMVLGWSNVTGGLTFIATSTLASGVTSVTGTYPIISSGGATPDISLAFGTTTSNTWAGTQVFTNAPTLATFSGLVGANSGLTYAIASSSLFGFTPQTNQLAKGNFLVGDDAGVAQATSSIFISSTGLVGIGTTSPTQLLSVHGNGLFSGNLSIAGLTATGTVSLATALGISSGGTGLSSISGNQLLYTNSAGTAFLQVATSSLSIGGNAATVTTNANLTGVITSVGNTTSYAATAGANTLLANATGGAAAPTFISTSTLNIGGTAGNVTGTVAIANGGTGLSSLTGNRLLYSNSDGSAFAQVATSSLYGASTGGMVLGWSNVTGGLTFIATSTGGSGISTSLTKGWTLVGDDSGVAQATSSIFINSTGNVGIGSTTPNALLTLVGTPSLNPGRDFFSISTSSNASSTPFFRVASSTAFIIDGGVTQPTHKGSLANGAGGALLGTAQFVFVSGNYAYVASNASNALEIIDISNPAAPIHKGSLSNGVGGALLTNPYSVFVSGNYAYVASLGSNALEIVDISNPAAPVHKGSLANGAGGALLGQPYSVFVSGNYAYVVSVSSNALEIVDISNPAAPVHKGSLANGAGGALLNTPVSVFVSGNYAYVASSNSDALEIVDISNPAAPVHKGSLANGAGGALLDAPQSVFVSGNYAYVASYSSSALEIVDISNPVAPIHKGSLSNGVGGALLTNPYSVFVSGNYAYVASVSSNALEIIDISNPATPVHKAKLTNGAGGALLTQPASVFVSGNYAYVASSGSSALEVIDIGGAYIANTHIGSAKIDTLQVSNFAQFNQNLLVSSGLNVGGSGLFGGTLTVSGNLASTSLLSVPSLNVGLADTNTSSIVDVANLFHTGTSTLSSVANGIGTGLLFSAQDNSTGSTGIRLNTATSTGRISSILTNISTSTPASALAFYTKNTPGTLTEWMRLDSSGNLGIGTTTPNAKLTISGGGLSAESLILSRSYNSIISTVVGSSTGYTNFSGGIGTGGSDSIGGPFNNALRLTHTGNLVNIGSIQGGELNLTNGGTFAAKVDYTTGTQPHSVSIGDVNGDGKADLVTANLSGASVSVFMNNGNGTFAAKVDYVAGPGPHFVAVGDLNGDGKADFAVTDQNNDVVSILMNNGNGTFATEVDYSVGLNPYSIVIGDLNSDGKADLAVANQSATSVSILMNNGNGTFATKVDYTTGSTPNSVTIGDVNGDGKADLAVANSAANSVSIFLNNGNGTFATKVDYTTGSNPNSVAIGDVNGDGKLDVVTANLNGPSASVLINNGNGTFATKVDYTAGGTDPRSISVGDLNGDGKLDLVTANAGTPDSISVFINNGNGTFATKVDYTPGANPYSVTIGDVNGDGKADLAVANLNSNSVSVFLNNATPVLYAQASSGNISIGTSSPYAKLSIQSSLGSQLPLFDIATTTSSTFATSSLFTVLANGKVGIGSTSPAQLLSVHGNGLFSGNLSVAGLTATGTVSLATALGISSGGTGLSSVSGNQLLYSNSDGTAFLQVATSSLSIGGNALTATTLQTARTINGVSFNGSANIVVASTTLLGDTNTWSGNNTFSNTPTLATLTGLVGANNGTLYQIASSSLFGFIPQTNQLAKGNFLVGNDAGVAQATSSIFISSTGQVGIASSSPWGLLSVNPNGITGPSFVIGSSTATSLIVANSGFVGIATSSPLYNFTVNQATSTSPLNAIASFTGNGGVGQWNTTTSLATGENTHTSVTANGYVYVIGGNVGGTGQTNIQYAKLNADGTVGAWASTTPLATGEYGHTSVVANGYVYAIGGNTSSGVLVQYAKLNADGTIGAWRTTTQIATGQRFHTSVVANGFVYVIGGISNTAIVQYAKLNADGTIGAWQTSANTMIAGGVYNHTSVVANGYVYAISGFDGTVSTTTVTYAKLNSDGTTGAWAITSPTVTGQSNPTSVVANGYVYMIGGSENGNLVQYAKINNNGTLGTWQVSTALPTGENLASSVVANGYIYVLGGNSSGSNLVQYAPLQRVMMNGTLDLIGLAGGTLGDANTNGGQGSVGGSVFAGNIFSNGTLEVTGNTMLQGGLGVNGNLTLNATSSLPQNFSIFSVNNATGTASVLTALYSGNVGIGTSTPGNLLSLSRAFSTGRTSVVVIDDTDGISASDALLTDYRGGGTTMGRFGTEYDGTRGNFVFRDLYNSGAGSTEIMRISGNGNVGIGTTSPYRTLSVAGSGVFTGGDVLASTLTATSSATIGTLTGLVGANNGLLYQFASSSLFGFTPQTNQLAKGNFLVGDDAGVAQATSSIFISSTGNVGIGTTTPQWNLQIAGTRPSFALTDTAGALDNKHWLFSSMGGNLYIGTSTDAYATSTPSALTILNNGSIGIGSSSPFTTLGVTGTVRLKSITNSANALVVESASSTQVFQVSTVDDNSNIFSVATSTGASYFEITSGGKIGFGTTSPYAKLSVVDNSGSGLRDVFAISTSTNGLVFKVDSYGNTKGDGAYSSPAADYAEYFYTNSVDLKSGEVVCVDVIEHNAVKRCERGADNNVMGIVSTKPSVIGNYIKAVEASPSHYAIIGMLGQVDAYVSAENGPIMVGDSLTSASSVPGYAMLASDGDSTVGIALEPLAKDTGKIKVLISRRNKSLAVEEVESLVVERIANMKIEDRVQQLIQDATNSITLSKLVVSGSISAGGYETALSPVTAFTLGSTTTMAEIPADVLTVGGKVDLYKLATYNLSGVNALAEKIGAQDVRITSLESRVEKLESGVVSVATTSVSSQVGSLVDLSTSTLASAMGAFGAFIQKGIVQFGTLVTDRFVAATDSAGTSSAGTVTILAGNTVAQVTNAYVLPTSKIFVTLTASTTGSWYISDKQAGSFKLVLSAPQTTDVSFDYFLVQTEGQIATSTSAASLEAPPPSEAAPTVTSNQEPIISITEVASTTIATSTTTESLPPVTPVDTATTTAPISTDTTVVADTATPSVITTDTATSTLPL